MRFVIQRVTESSVTVDNQVIAQISKGFLVLIGINREDTVEKADKMVKKLLGLRIFEDENGKTNLDLKSVGGSLLLVSQFTLYADCKKGNRPSFINAGEPHMANELYEYIIKLCRQEIPVVETGKFGADMKIALLNDGPFTVILDSEELGI
ncbi:MAG: D-tyrosyl-tRNA(Tyr) deacylase [Acetatifactor sp.]|nr:D-tyrosyl-tRNA(Tyr) deacylase [Acetatifactor sp.]MDE6701544.1 D-tyrosyl-tRNA(Tyr) deacylase [Acetatifactor sp.]MDE7112781.1 D-tyrosyl-tRNA(Tyr) deacylase [Acetatifactor sp.]